MRAQVLEEFNKEYVFKDIPKPNDPEGKDILVEVHAASYCHTDAVFASGSMWQDLPRVGSHEFAGKIIALGPDVDKSQGLFEGQHVGVPGRAYRPCGKCYECKNNDGDPTEYGGLRMEQLGRRRGRREEIVCYRYSRDAYRGQPCRYLAGFSATAA